MSFKKILAVLVFVCATESIVLADPPGYPKDLWRTERDPTSYVRYDSFIKKYVETVYCHRMYEFDVIRRDLNEVWLQDRSRNLDVLIDFDGMWTSAINDTEWHFHKRGTFDHRKFFYKVGDDGTHHGNIELLDACTWLETFPGGEPIPFVEAYLSPNEIDIFDGRRTLYVRMTADAMLIRDNDHPFARLKGGHW